MRPPGAYFVAQGDGVWAVHFGEVPVGRIVPDGGRFTVQFRCRGLALEDTCHDERYIAETYCLGVLAALQYQPSQETPRATSH